MSTSPLTTMLFAVRSLSLTTFCNRTCSYRVFGARNVFGDFSCSQSDNQSHRTLVTGSLAHRRLLRRRKIFETPYPVGKVVPTLEIASNMPLAPSEMDNHALLTLSELQNHDARIEVLKRHIMVVENVPYGEAEKIFEEIKQSNRRGMVIEALPYQIAIGVAVTGAFASFPLTFHLDSVHWFNEHFVTADVPEPKDLETWLEVGGWAWNWVEPVLGQLSFFLLCMQYARAQLMNLGRKPFTSVLKIRRAKRLCSDFPQYDPKVLCDFSETDRLHVHEY